MLVGVNSHGGSLFIPEDLFPLRNPRSSFSSIISSFFLCFIKKISTCAASCFCVMNMHVWIHLTRKWEACISDMKMVQKTRLFCWPKMEDPHKNSVVWLYFLGQFGLVHPWSTYSITHVEIDSYKTKILLRSLDLKQGIRKIWCSWYFAHPKVSARSFHRHPLGINRAPSDPWP